MEAKIIAAVCGHPVLYDNSCYYYRDRTERELAWRTVSKEVGVSKERCRRKWKCLRDTYLKERKKEPKRRWKHSGALSFLDAFVPPREASGNVEQGVDEDGPAEDEGQEGGPEHGKTSQRSTAESESEKERKMEERLLHCLRQHVSAPAQSPSVDEMFLKSLAPSLQRLPPQQKECVKFQIHKLIYEAL